jgi:threonine aldolase
MAELTVSEIAAGCERFLNFNKPRTIRQRLQEVADSPLSLLPSDGYGRGGFLSDFEAEIAELLGTEAAAFMPSGTMAQPIALRIWADLAGIPTIAFHPTCHLELYEHHAYRELHGLRAVLLGGAERLMDLADIQAVTEPISTLLLELPQREIGGQLPSWEDLTKLCDEARSKGWRLHLDGARLWECAPFYRRSYVEIVSLFDSAYVSFYKVLDGLPGAALIGPRTFIEEARIWQRRQGGNLQQQSAGAMSAKLGLDIRLPRIPAYVAKAADIAEILRSFHQVRLVPEYPPTNMMHIYFEGDRDRLIDASLKIAKEDKVGLFFRLGENQKMELNVADAALELSNDEIKHLFEKLFTLAS